MIVTGDRTAGAVILTASSVELKESSTRDNKVFLACVRIQNISSSYLY